MSKLLVNVLVLSRLLQLGGLDEVEVDTDCDTPDCGERSPLSFGFIVRLYNSKNISCLGNIITLWWIIDNCEDFPGYPYEHFETGWATPKNSVNVYKIYKTIQHEGYKRIDLKHEKMDTSTLFAAENALFLRKSVTQIKNIPEITMPIYWLDKPNLPYLTAVLYVHNGTISKVTRIPLRNVSECNAYYKSFFDPGKQMLLDEKNLCVIVANKIKYDRCCNSHGMLVADNILMGIMAWSTQCSEEYGVGHWVFTHIGRYAKWVHSIIDGPNRK